MYVVNKDRRFRIFIQDAEDEDGTVFFSASMTDAARMILSNEIDADKLIETNLDIDIVEIYLDWLGTANVVTGIYPFMSMTKSNYINLENMYDVLQ